MPLRVEQARATSKSRPGVVNFASANSRFPSTLDWLRVGHLGNAVFAAVVVSAHLLAAARRI